VEYRKSRTVSLKAHEAYNEKWLQALIAEDPSILGMGDLVLKDTERRQPRAGRLDILLSDPETHTRYEVEIQLGATDEAHIIRTIEYWDIEKNRYPQYEHVAVIVAEDITSRFLNVISLFNRAIPLVAIQLRALEVDGTLTIIATTVLDLVRLGTDEEDDPGQPTDRSHWITRSSQMTLEILDRMLELVNTVSPGTTLKYNKHYIGLNRSGVVDNYVVFRPRRENLIAEFRIPRSDEVTAMIEDSGIDSLEYFKRYGQYRMRLSSKDLDVHRELLLDLVRRASRTPAAEEDSG
jgi:hypothetical protein